MKSALDPLSIRIRAERPLIVPSTVNIDFFSRPNCSGVLLLLLLLMSLSLLMMLLMTSIGSISSVSIRANGLVSIKDLFDKV